MATQRRVTMPQTINNRNNSKITYIHGSAAPKYERIPQKRPVKEAERTSAPDIQKKQKVQAKPSPVNVPLLILTLVAFVALGAMMLQYISLSSEISVLTNSIASLESDLNDLKAENDEYYGRIMSSVDLEKVREVAIMDLGMVYASEDQIITYESHVDDYVEQSRVIKD